MTRCKHPNVVITEYGTAQTIHDRVAPGEWLHDSDFGNYTGTVRIVCRSCGMDRAYGKKNRPLWLQKALAEIREATR